MTSINLTFTINEQNYRISVLEEVDLEFVRILKNTNRQAFFTKSWINRKKQIEWYQTYKDRKADTMFIIHQGRARIGCMGIRQLENEWDLYNVLIANGEHRGRGVMSVALSKIIAYTLMIKELPIRARVLSNNTALQWYRKNNFVVELEMQDHMVMRFIGER